MTSRPYTRMVESRGCEGPMRLDHNGVEHFLSSPESRCQSNAPCDGCLCCRAATE